MLIVLNKQIADRLICSDRETGDPQITDLQLDDFLSVSKTRLERIAVTASHHASEPGRDADSDKRFAERVVPYLLGELDKRESSVFEQGLRSSRSHRRRISSFVSSFRRHAEVMARRKRSKSPTHQQWWVPEIKRFGDLSFSLRPLVTEKPSMASGPVRLGRVVVGSELSWSAEQQVEVLSRKSELVELSYRIGGALSNGDPECRKLWSRMRTGPSDLDVPMLGALEGERSLGFAGAGVKKSDDSLFRAGLIASLRNVSASSFGKPWPVPLRVPIIGKIFGDEMLLAHHLGDPRSWGMISVAALNLNYLLVEISARVTDGRWLLFELGPYTLVFEMESEPSGGMVIRVFRTVPVTIGWEPLRLTWIVRGKGHRAINIENGDGWRPGRIDQGACLLIGNSEIDESRNFMIEFSAM